MRNFDISVDGLKRLSVSRESEVSDKKCEERASESGQIGVENLEEISPQVFGGLSQEALNYIQRLQSELSDVKEVSSEYFIFRLMLFCFQFDKGLVKLSYCYLTLRGKIQLDNQ